MLRTTALFLTCAASAVAQGPFVRDAYRADLNTTGFGVLPGIASADNLTAVIWADRAGGTSVGTQRVSVTVADGRGITWAAPVIVDSSTVGNRLTQNDSVAIAGTNVYAAWSDERNGSSFDDIFFNRSTNGGVAWVGEQRLGIGPIMTAGVGVVRQYRMVAVAPDVVHVLMLIDPNTTSNEQLWLATSIGGGAFVGTPVYTGPDLIDEIALAADSSGVVLAAFVAGVTDEVFCARSTNLGFSFAAPVKIDTDAAFTGDAGEVQVALDGAIAVVAWLDRFTSATIDELRVAVSVDGGATFGIDKKVGGYVAGTQDIDNFALGVGGGSVYLGYGDVTGVGYGAFVTSSPDLGANWRPDVLVSTAAKPSQPRFAGSGKDAGFAYWEGPSATANAGACYTTDGGATWTTDVRLSTIPLDVDFVELAYNPLYRNFVSVWQQDDGSRNRLDVGGFRAPTCAAIGFGAGPMMSHFDFRGYDPTHVISYALISASPGPLPLFFFGDPRDIGLTPDALFAAAASVPAVFSTGLINGVGSTSAFTTNLVSGFSIVYAGVTLHPVSGFGDLADVRRITVP